MPLPDLRPQLAASGVSAADAGSTAVVNDGLHAIKQGIARAQADTQAILAAETREACEARASASSLERAQAECAASREAEARMRVDEKAGGHRSGEGASKRL